MIKPRLKHAAKKQRDDDLSGDERFNAEAVGNKSPVRSSKSAEIKVKALRNRFLNSL
jgi:hypothetical protein